MRECCVPVVLFSYSSPEDVIKGKLSIPLGVFSTPHRGTRTESLSSDYRSTFFAFVDAHLNLFRTIRGGKCLSRLPPCYCLFDFSRDWIHSTLHLFLADFCRIWHTGALFYPLLIEICPEWILVLAAQEKSLWNYVSLHNIDLEGEIRPSKEELEIICAE